MTIALADFVASTSPFEHNARDSIDADQFRKNLMIFTDWPREDHRMVIFFRTASATGAKAKVFAIAHNYQALSRRTAGDALRLVGP